MNGLLIVDDEEGVRRSLTRVLLQDGYALYAAKDGLQAIEMVRDRAGHMGTVICDLKMPGIDGLETLIEIGRLDPEITRIMLTGYATVESAIESVNIGIDGFLTKPFSNVEMRAKVRECILKKRLKQFISEQVFTELQKNGVSLYPMRRKVTVLFSDIRGFSRIAEAMEAEMVSAMLNEHYFTPLDRIICDHGGTLDKHIGDNIMGVFGAPAAHGDEATRAVRCAMTMLKEMERTNELLMVTGVQMQIGIGIATGEVMAGIFGSSRKREYTVFGHPVNIAARLEALALANQILICENTYQGINGSNVARIERMNTMHLRGMNCKIDIYRLIA